MKQLCYKLVLTFIIFLGLNKPLLAANIVWIDIRSSSEWEQGHLKNAVNIPYQKLSEKIFNIVDNKDTPINIYGSDGRRSIIAQKTLENLGFINVQNLGSYDDLKSRDHP